ncbi:unnamed protein product, partial [marine sediment metagenome]
VLKSNIKIKDINIDSKSGVSGAGRKLKDEYLFGSLDNNFYAYSAEGHRHTGEIEQEIESMSGKNFKINFTPHLLPVNRGIFTSIYCKLDGVIEEEKTEKQICSLFENFYKCSPFVKFRGKKIPQLKDVIGTNMCLIGFCLDVRADTLKIFSVIDNLLKGAAGQAVQNMNIMMAFDKDMLYSNKIIVRRAGKGENIKTIDDSIRILDDDTLVIADEDKAVAIAGIMGGKDTEISENTKNVLLESANFYGPSIMRTSKKIGLRSEASNRFEKKIDPMLTV